MSPKDQARAVELLQRLRAAWDKIIPYVSDDVSVDDLIAEDQLIDQVDDFLNHQ